MTAHAARGSTLVELMVTISLIGALAAIGMPNYLSYTENGREAQCATNRHTLEAAERACALDNGGKPCLKTKKLAKSGYLGATPTCASGGKYVWIVTDADQPDYPKAGCSKHFYPTKKAKDSKKAKKKR